MKFLTPNPDPDPDLSTIGPMFCTVKLSKKNYC
jgi:hypothetical protein